MNKAEKQAQAWAIFHEHLPEYVNLIEQQIPEELLSLRKDVEALKTKLASKK